MADVFTLRILFDGDVPGLDKHRLSLSAFGDAFQKLIAAYRRIASSILSDAIESSSSAYGSRGGRYARMATMLDLELKSVENGCVELAIVGTQEVPPQTNYDLVNGLAERAGNMLLDAIQVESQGEWRNHMVRSYLSALPKGLSRQRYSLASGSGTPRTIEIAGINVSLLPKSSPFFDRIEGTIVGVGFEPGPTEVRIKSEGGIDTFAASPKQVSAALELRGAPIQALVLKGTPVKRLIWAKRTGDVKAPPTAKEIRQYVSATWDVVLRRLAQ